MSCPAATRTSRRSSELSGSGLLIVLSAPSGAGKGTVRAGFQQRHPEVCYAVSATTRRPRPDEVDGVHYHFYSLDEFEARLRTGEFVEHSRVYDNYYGTPRRPMEDWLAEGRDVIVEKDIQGAAKLRPTYPDAVYVFILPPSMEELRARITRRGTESPEARQQRLASASLELSYLSDYDYAIVNEDLNLAVAQLEAIWTAEGLRTRRQPELLRRLLADG